MASIIQIYYLFKYFLLGIREKYRTILKQLKQWKYLRVKVIFNIRMKWNSVCMPTIESATGVSIVFDSLNLIIKVLSPQISDAVCSVFNFQSCSGESPVLLIHTRNRLGIEDITLGHNAMWVGDEDSLLKWKCPLLDIVQYSFS